MRAHLLYQQRESMQGGLPNKFHLINYSSTNVSTLAPAVSSWIELFSEQPTSTVGLRKFIHFDVLYKWGA